MNKTTNCLILLLMVILTVAVSFGPYVINEIDEKRMVSQTEYWTHDNPGELKFTSSDFANFYTANGLYLKTESNQKAAKKTCIQMLNTVFNNHEPLLNRLLSFVQTAEVAYSESVFHVISVQNKPVLLKYIVAVYENKTEHLEIAYEEKTSTLISLYFSIIPDNDTSLCEDFAVAGNEYYHETLGLAKNDYTIYTLPSEKTDTSEYVHLYCELNYHDPSEKEELDELVDCYKFDTKM